MARTIGITFSYEANVILNIAGGEYTGGLLYDRDTGRYFRVDTFGANLGIGFTAGATTNFVFSTNPPEALGGFAGGLEQNFLAGVNLGIGYGPDAGPLQMNQRLSPPTPPQPRSPT